MQGFFMKDYIEERAIEIANYIIEERTTVRQAAKKFGISKSTIHMEVTKQNGLCGWQDDKKGNEEILYLLLTDRFLGAIFVGPFALILNIFFTI